MVAGTTDAAWLAGRLNAALRATLDRPDVDPVQALTKVEANVHSGFLAIDRELSRPAGEQPSAALALAALQGNALHLIGIADCQIIYEALTGANALVNEDAIGATTAGAWVIDGATGVSDRPPIGGWNDGCGMASRTIEC